MALSCSMLCSAVTMLAQPPPTPSILALPLSRKSFPEGFTFGASTSAMQIEGAYNRHGKGLSIWDDFTQKYPDKIKDRKNIEVACNSYELYKEDVKLLKDMNMDAYRFSLSWSRILPNGKLDSRNQHGIDYYHKLIDALHHHGLEPYVTIFHFDVPLALQEEYGGALGAKFIHDYAAFAELCFEEFGCKVKHWITMNEPLIFCTGFTGRWPPLRSSGWQKIEDSIVGNVAEEPYKVSHNLLLAHAAAVEIYRRKYQDTQNGQIGITLNSNWYVPHSQHIDDRNAALRAVDFSLGKYLHPLTYGDYPKIMQDLVGKRLPKFSTEDSRRVRQSYDFLGLNYYTSNFAADNPTINNPPSFNTDNLVEFSTERDGKPIGLRGASNWLYAYPRGIHDLVCYIKDHYNNPAIYITENGLDQYNEPTESREESLMDIYRIDYLYRHLYHLHSAITDQGVNVKGYFYWSLLDDFEMLDGYSVRFGLSFVDFENGCRRYPKYSAKWFSDFLKKKKRSDMVILNE